MLAPAPLIDMLDLLLELLFNRLGLAILAIAIAIAGVHVWTSYRAEASLYDASVGSEGRTATAKIAWKGSESVASSYDDGDESVDYFKIEYEYEGETIETKAYVNAAEFAKYDLSDEIEVRFNPSSKQFVVTPGMKRPSVMFATVGSITLIVISGLILIGVVISFL